MNTIVSPTRLCTERAATKWRVRVSERADDFRLASLALGRLSERNIFMDGTSRQKCP